MKPNTLKSIRRTLVGGLSAAALSVASLTSNAAVAEGSEGGGGSSV